MHDAAFARSPKLLTPSPLREGAALFAPPAVPPSSAYAPGSPSRNAPAVPSLALPEPEPEPQCGGGSDEDDDEWTPDDEPVLMRFSLGAGHGAGHGADLEALERGFEVSVAALLGCDRERISWVDAAEDGEGGCSVDFCIYAADEAEAAAAAEPLPSCASLGEALIETCTPEKLAEVAALASLAGAALSNITDLEEDEWEDE